MKSVNITYFVHGTTTDNEKGKASGWADARLSELGKKQSLELKELIKDKKFDVIFCSDLKRAVDSANLTFGDSVKIIQDKRLREMDYGDFNGKNAEKVESMISERIHSPFPNGESCQDVEKRTRDFLNYLLKKFSGKNVAIIGHKATQRALDVLLREKTWEQAIKEDWRHKRHAGWKPGWEYILIQKPVSYREASLRGIKIISGPALNRIGCGIVGGAVVAHLLGSANTIQYSALAIAGFILVIVGAALEFFIYPKNSA